MTPNLIVDLPSLRQSSAGQITGGIHWALDSGPFPDSEWDDFVVVVLTWWSEAVLRLRRGDRSVTLDFMDGPPSIELRSSDESIELRAIHSPDREPSDVGTVELNLLATELCCAMNAVVRECRDRRFAWSDDLTELDARLKELQALK